MSLFLLFCFIPHLHINLHVWQYFPPPFYLFLHIKPLILFPDQKKKKKLLAKKKKKKSCFALLTFTDWQRGVSKVIWDTVVTQIWLSLWSSSVCVWQSLLHGEMTFQDTAWACDNSWSQASARAKWGQTDFCDDLHGQKNKAVFSIAAVKQG